MYIALYDRKFLNEFLGTFRYESILLLLIISYSLLRDLAGGEIVYFDRFLLWVFQAFIFGFFITKIHHQKNHRNYLQRKPQTNLFNVTYWAGFIASLLTLLLILYPAFDRLYESIQLDEYYERYASFEVRYRAYGIAENLTFTYSYVLGLFAGYSLLMINRQKYLIIPFFTFLIGVIFNARIGFVAILVFLFIVFFQKRWSNIVTFLSLLGVILLSYTLFAEENVLFTLLSNDWALDFFRQISDTLFGTSLSQYGNTFDTLTGSFVALPQDTLEWVFGSGKSLFNAFDNNTDIGYLLQLNYGGILLLSLIILFILVTSARLIKSLKYSHWFTTFLILSILILNYKGFIFAGTPGGRLLFFYYVYFIYNKRNTKAHTIIGKNYNYNENNKKDVTPALFDIQS
ncbi:MAG: hypothetical protein Q4G42_07870 [Neisseria sp.]|nr:hypothetical protein [Neisseria sp.]